MITEENRYQRAEEIKLINLRTHRAAEHLLKMPVNADIPLRISCECGAQHCDLLVTLPFSTLESARKEHIDDFIITPSHMDDTKFKTVRQAKSFLIVAKLS